MHEMTLKDFCLCTGHVYEDTSLYKIIRKAEDLGIFKDPVWIAGGALRRTALGQSLKESDVDFFFYDEACLNRFDNIISTGFGVEKIESDFNNTYLNHKIHKKVQAIKLNFYDSPEDVIDSFDYTICQIITDGIDVWMGDNTMWDLANRKLRPHNISMPLASTRRLLKYTRQGFYACTGCLKTVLQSAQGINFDIEPEYID